ncbi:MAG TPA: permease [Opitutaceae bacterium]|nr:permease [Opitutaceae bacterium]
MQTLLASFLHLLSDTVVPFVLGLLLGSALEAFLPRRWAERWLASGTGSLAIATLAGALLPGCAMSTVPVARSLRARGAPLGTVAAFLLIAPLISPHTVALTAAMVGGGFAAARVILPIAFTLAFGAVANALSEHAVAKIPSETRAGDASCCGGTTCSGGGDAADETCDDDGACGCANAGAPEQNAFGRFLRQTIANLRALAPLYVGSIAVVAVLTAFVPPARIAEYGDGVLAYGAALLGGIPLYVCDGGEVPLTRSLLELGLGPGPAFTFMLASVGTCLPTIAMSLGIIGRRLTFAYVAGVLVLALLSGLLVAGWPFLQPAVGAA